MHSTGHANRGSAASNNDSLPPHTPVQSGSADSPSPSSSRHHGSAPSSPPPPSHHPHSSDCGGATATRMVAAAAAVDGTHQPMRNYDGTTMRDRDSNVVYRSQFLATHPLKSDCKERVGYAGKKFTYVSGDGVIRTMNAIFGHAGWSSRILSERVVLSEKDDRGRWCVGYLASVRVTLLGPQYNGACHEDCGSGEGIDNSKIKAHEKAMKSSVTDAMKRAARHFGERLGNALYVKGAGIRSAPRTNGDALRELDRKDALNLFGDQAALALRANGREEQQCSPSPESRKSSASGTAKVVIATGASASVASNASNGANAGQKENWPQNNNRVVVRTANASAAGKGASFHNRPSPDDGGVSAAQLRRRQSAPPPSGAAAALPSPIASCGAGHPRRGTVVPGARHPGTARAGNPSPAYNNGALTMHRPSPHNNINNNNSATNAPQHQHLDPMNVPQPPNLMAPPPRPIYNPDAGGGAGVAQYNGTAGGGNNVHRGGKRSFDGSVVHNYDKGGNGQNGGNFTNANNVDGGGGGDSSKRQKANPYSNKRVSI